MNKNKHLNLDKRCQIEKALNNGNSFKAIGKLIDKDCTTIAKEVKAHILFEKKGSLHRPFNDCTNRKNCFRYGDVCKICERQKSQQKCAACGRCTTSCMDYIKEVCPKLSKAPYVCNGCDQRRSCTLEKRFYRALDAQKEYHCLNRAILSITSSLIIRIKFPAVKKQSTFMLTMVYYQQEISTCPEK